MFKWVTLSAAAVLGGTLLAGQAGAVTKELTGLDVNGNTVASGWTYTVDDSLAANVNLVFIRAEGNNFFIEKDATIRRASDPVVINFDKVAGATSAMNLVINDEAVDNQSGEDWAGFRMVLSSGTNGAGQPNFSFATHDGSPGLGDFAIDPFTQFQFSNDNSELLINGGTVKAGDSWFPGAQSNTGLAIVANGASSSFTLKEIAIPIPLPAAAWTGLTGLAFVAIARATKQARV